MSIRKASGIKMTVTRYKLWKLCV